MTASSDGLRNRRRWKRCRRSVTVAIFVVLSEHQSTQITEFSPNLIGLTGTKEEIDRVAKLYRIYYSAGPKDIDGDYIVDHTVVMYLLDPNGQFSEFYGQTKSAAEVTKSIQNKMAQFSG